MEGPTASPLWLVANSPSIPRVDPAGAPLPVVEPARDREDSKARRRRSKKRKEPRKGDDKQLPLPRGPKGKTVDIRA